MAWRGPQSISGSATLPLVPYQEAVHEPAAGAERCPALAQRTKETVMAEQHSERPMGTPTGPGRMSGPPSGPGRPFEPMSRPQSGMRDAGMGQEDSSTVDQIKEKGQQAVDRVKEQGQQAAHTIEETADTGIDRAAEAAQGLAETLRQRADQLPGDKATQLAHQAASGLEQGASYLRETSASELRGDLETMIRRHPTRSLAVGVAIGFLLARAFR